MDFDDAQDWAWCDSQLTAIETYVKQQQLPHGIICDSPEWFAAPYVALWAVEDAADPGYVGFWILAGDSSGSQPQPVPFDHLPATDITEPRDAMAAFAKKWAQLAAAAAKGQTWQGPPLLNGEVTQQAKQLARQAQLLQLWASDDELWEQDE
ncbi:DUF4826 family protein [Rheinheimera sp.]|uniref:DUF4826 family protein n=1 Tax=Rheinheimera sp. TaxID=1869214 RepID=UPI0027B8F945|nr:DUF4826 family protein [Rheinheimera sp.]